MVALDVIRPIRKRAGTVLVAAVLVGLGGCDEPELVWLPDSTGFVYPDKGGTRVVHYDLAKRARRVVTEDAKAWCRRPAVSPDGRSVAVARQARTSVAGSTTETVTVEAAVHGLDGREIRRSRPHEWTARNTTAATESKAVTELSQVVWAGHADRVLTPYAIYDRAGDRWIPGPAAPVAFVTDHCRPGKKGFLAFRRVETDKDAVVISLVDWDGWASEFKESFRLSGAPKTGGVTVAASWDGDVWQSVSTDGVFAVDTKAMTYRFEPGNDTTWDDLGRPDAIHRFPGDNLYLLREQIAGCAVPPVGVN